MEMTVRKAMESRNVTIHDDGPTPDENCSHSEPINTMKHWTRSIRHHRPARIPVFPNLTIGFRSSEQPFLQMTIVMLG
jgi:hypothetical protein